MSHATIDEAPAGVPLDAIIAFGDESNEELIAELDEDFGLLAATQGKIVARLGEVQRRGSWRDQGATSSEAWVSERYGVSVATAKTFTRLGEKAPALPHLVGALCAGEVSLDKVRVVADVATPTSDLELCALAQRHDVSELAQIARTEAQRAAARSAKAPRPGQDRRTLRFNDTFGTMTLQLPALEYAQTKATVEARAKAIPSDGQTPWDERLADAHAQLIGAPTSGTPASGASGSGAPASGASGSAASKAASGPSRVMVVAHVPLEALVDEEVEPTELAAELEHHGLIDVATVRGLACDATIAIAVDDDVGHTMYEGRARRFASATQRREVIRRDRTCRFPGCRNVTFAAVHHVVPWKLGGRTDLDNLVLCCEFHHGVVHRNGWSMTGNANEELTIVGPTGRVMVSRPSPIWTRASGSG